jgi:hypothetical protein
MERDEDSQEVIVEGCESSCVGLSERELQVGGVVGRFGDAKLHVEGVAGSSRGSDCKRQCRGGRDAGEGLQFEKKLARM